MSQTNRTPVPDDSLVVAVEGGRIRGGRIVADGSRTTQDTVTWRGVPFAAPPLDELRWRGPQPVEPWEGVRDTIKFGDGPMQKPDVAYPISEDCLTVNITRRADSFGTDADPRPVLVFFYGGSNAGGSSSYPLFEGLPLLMDEDIVFVTANYRVGAFGFVDFSAYSTPDSPIESNLALRDQLGVLEWVQRNIAAFGGDPSRVTISGQSAGALAVTSLLTVPRAKGLFSAAIAQSSPVASTSDPARAASRAARVVEALGATPQTANERLFSVEPHELVRVAGEALSHAQVSLPGALTYCSVVDGDLLPEHPVHALSAGRGHPVPLLIGTVLNEGTVFTGVNVPVPPAHQIRAMLSTQGVLPQHVLKAYPDFPLITATSAVMGDFLFWAPSTQAAAGHATVAPTWMYRYDHGTPMLKSAHLLPTHGMDLPAIFGYNATPLARVAKAVTRPATRTHLEHRTREIWLELITTGTLDWEPYDAQDRATYVIDHDDHLEHDPYPQRREVWEDFPYYF